MLRELLDRVAAVQQHALVAVDVGDARAAARRREEAGVVGEHPGLAVQRADVDHVRADRAAEAPETRRSCRRRSSGSPCRSVAWSLQSSFARAARIPPRAVALTRRLQHRHHRREARIVALDAPAHAGPTDRCRRTPAARSSAASRASSRPTRVPLEEPREHEVVLEQPAPAAPAQPPQLGSGDRHRGRPLDRALDHQLLDLADGAGRVEPLRADVDAVHDRCGSGTGGTDPRGCRAARWSPGRGCRR